MRIPPEDELFLLRELSGLQQKAVEQPVEVSELLRVGLRMICCDSVALFNIRERPVLEGLATRGGTSLQEELLLQRDFPTLERWAAGSGSWLMERLEEPFFPGERFSGLHRTRAGEALYFGFTEPIDELAETRCRFFSGELQRVLPSLEEVAGLRERADDVAQKVAVQEDRLRNLERLMQTLPSLAEELEKAKFVALFFRQLHSNLGFSRAVVSQETLLRWEAPGALPLGEGVEKELAKIVCESGRTLYLEDLKSTRFHKDAVGFRSVVGLPLAQGEAALLFSAQRFSRSDLHMLEAAGRLLALGLGYCRLHKQATESQARLVEAGRLIAVGQLAAGVAHEVNNPLGAIKMAITYTRRKQGAEEVREQLLDQALKAVERVQGITEKLLYYTRDAVVGATRVELNGLVRDNLLLLGRQAESKGSSLAAELAPEELWTLVNEGEVQQVLTNLVLNAVDAVAGCETTRITVRTGREGGEVYLEVADRGLGVPAALRERIFEPFFTTKEVGRGSGLGLSVSAEIASQHGGRLELLDSEAGARFRLSFPVSEL